MHLALTLVALLAAAHPSALHPAPGPAPAAIEQVIPQEATFALYEPRVRGDLLRAIGALQGVFGAQAAEAFLSDAPLPFLALEAAAGEPHQAIDARGGIGLFRVAGIQASAGLVAVKRPDAVIAELAEHLGARVDTRGELTWLYGAERMWAVLTEGGYLYLLIPDPQPPGLLADEAPKHALESMARAIRERKGSLANAELYRVLDRKVARGQLGLFLGGFEPRDALRGALLRAHLGDAGSTLDGFVLGSGPLFTAHSGKASSPLLTSGAPHSFGLASFDAGGNELTAFFLGEEGSRRRQLARRALAGLWLDVEGLLSAAEGPIALAAYLTPPRPGAELEGEPRSALAVRLEAPIRDPELARAWLRDLRHRVGPDALQASTRGGELHADLGPVPRGRANLLPAARALLGTSAFGPGHLTFLLDLVRIRHLLLAERSSASTEALERLNAVTEIDRAWLDLAGDPEGARVKGVLRLEVQ